MLMIIISHQLMAVRAPIRRQQHQPQENKLKPQDHVLREVVNDLRDIALKFHDTDQLRERLRGALAPLLEELAATPAHAAGGSLRWLGLDVAHIQAAPVLRDETGNWWHPDMPPFDDGDGEKFKAWLLAQGLELSRAELGDEPEDHPAYKAVFEDANCDFSAWEPEPPAGAGWFMLAISDTEDGPACCWVRRAPPAAPAP